MFSSVLLFLNIGGPEMILIVFVALLLFGGEKLPEIARGLGKGIRDFKDASEGVKRELTNQIYNYEEKKEEEAAATPVAEPAPVEDPSHLIAENSVDEVAAIEHVAEVHGHVAEVPVAQKIVPQPAPNTIPVSDIPHAPVAESQPAHASETPIEPIITHETTNK